MKSQNESQVRSDLTILPAHLSFEDELIRMEGHYNARLQLMRDELDLVKKRLRTVLYVHSTQFDSLMSEFARDLQSLRVLGSDSEP